MLTQTIYGSVQSALVDKFCKLAGHKLVDGQWVVLSDELQYWQLVNPGSTVDDKRWAKRLGWLTIRDINFQYALLKTTVDGQVSVHRAMAYVEQFLIDVDGSPVYLPEELARKQGLDTNKKPKSYNKILTEMEDSLRVNL